MAEFIHSADWHLGNRFSKFSPEMRKKLTDALYLSVESIFLYAKKEKIPLILCAGDAIDDGQLADVKQLDRLFRVVSKYPEVKLILIAGNHDPLMANSIYLRYEKSLFPANFQLVTNDEILAFPEFKLQLFASSVKEKNGNYNILNWIKQSEIDKNKINVGLGHGSIQNERFSDTAFPVEPDFARQKNLDYLALGDWHSYQKINERTYYPGVPEPLQFGDRGFPLRVTIKEPGAVPIVKPITGIQQYTWQDMEKTISDRDFSTFQTEFGSVGLREVRKIKISGFLSPANYKIYKELLRYNQPQYFGIIDEVSLQPDDKELLRIGDGVVQDLIKKLSEMKKNGEKIPEEIFNRVVPFNRENVEREAEAIKINEVVDRALLKIYQLFGE